MDQAALTIHADTMAGDLLSALVDELRLMPKPWPALPEVEQTEIIDRLRARVSHNVREVVQLIHSDGRVTVSADLEQIGFAKRIKLVLAIDKNAAGKHDLIDVLGQPVLLVLANPEDYLGGIGTVKADADQGTLDLEGEANQVIERAKNREPPATPASGEPPATPEPPKPPPKKHDRKKKPNGDGGDEEGGVKES